MISSSQLSEKLLELNFKVANEETGSQTLDEIAKNQADLDEMMQQKSKSAIFKTKIKWYEQGEKSTKYFFYLERARYNARTCHKLINS